jgi:hypothetical protein
MDPLTALVTAIVAGATVATKDAASQAVKDAYAGLRRILVDGYSLLSVKLLEKNPKNPAFEQAVKEELTTTKAAADSSIANAVKELTAALSREQPHVLSSSGIDLGNVVAAQNVLIERLAASGPISIGDVKAESGDAIIRDLRAGKQN